MRKLSDCIAMLYSYILKKCISGDVSAIKILYVNICGKHPAHLKTITILQRNLSLKTIHEGNYSDEFLYYLGMICLGELSNYIEKLLPTAKECFNMIKENVPKAEARLAYIELLKSDELHNNDENVRRIDKLREWTVNEDCFSAIALAKIVFQEFILKNDIHLKKNKKLKKYPLKAIRLIENSLYIGRPEAIIFYKTIFKSKLNKKTYNINPSTLLDFNKHTIMQIEQKALL